VLEEAQFLTVEELARLLRVDRRAVYRAVARGEIPAIKVGRQFRVPKSFVEEVQKRAAEMAGEFVKKTP